MKVLMLLDEEFPPDSRVEKEAISLIEEGFDVSIACYTRKGLPAYQQYKGIHVWRMPISKFMYKMSAACLILPFYFMKWRNFCR